jgi:hypothetical protein
MLNKLQKKYKYGLSTIYSSMYFWHEQSLQNIQPKFAQQYKAYLHKTRHLHAQAQNIIPKSRQQSFT